MSAPSHIRFHGPRIPGGSAALLWLGALLCAAGGYAKDPVRLIAHRGGVVDAQRPENSAAALEEAIRRGYWMVEMDVQESKDGHLAVHHDDFLKSFGDKRWPGQMTWEEIRKLRAAEDGSRPLEFHEYAALCRGRMRLMIDTKEPSHPPGFYEQMERVLRENGLLDEVFFIGTVEARAYFKGKGRARISVESTAELRKLVDAGEPVSGTYFLFEHGTSLAAEGIELARRCGVPAVVSINEFHYAGLDHMKAAHADIVRLGNLGVTYFQIDSIYDQWLR
ncbi:MAG TPA: glycerophosphodiester phosphodiesterase family protein [Bryobacteraceae bacterium]|nr:glycerophosphodiester phosphodiesterase family protein [Bryobacteraceae bacterium]